MIDIRPRQQFNRFLRTHLGYQFTKVAALDPRLEDYGFREKTETPRFIDIGAGTRIHPLWHGIDNPRPEYGKSIWSDIAIDLTDGKPWPIQSDSINLAYTSHTVEHLNDKFNDQVFRETLRVLKPGGYLRITCPNIDLYVDAYERKDEDFFRHGLKASGGNRHSIEQMLLNAFASPLSSFHISDDTKRLSDDEVRSVFGMRERALALDDICNRIPDEIVRKYPQHHKTWLTPAKLIIMLRAAGFSTAYQSCFGQSRTPEMRNTDYFDFRHPSISLYVEARK